MHAFSRLLLSFVSPLTPLITTTYLVQLLVHPNCTHRYCVLVGFFWQKFLWQSSIQLY